MLCTTPMKFEWENHMGWNLKGLVSLILGSRAKESIIGQRSEWILFKCLTIASGYSIFHSVLMKTLSILYWMSWVTGLRFDQIKWGPEKPISIILQLSKQSWNLKALLILIDLPLNLSSLIRILLKSPTMAHDREWRFAMEERLS